MCLKDQTEKRSLEQLKIWTLKEQEPEKETELQQSVKQREIQEGYKILEVEKKKVFQQEEVMINYVQCYGRVKFI